MSEKKTISLPIQHTQKWVQKVVIGCNFCPFAAYALGHIRYVLDEHTTWELALQHLITECHYLDTHPTTVTTLLVYPDGLHDFESYLNFVDIATQLLSDQGYDSVYQIATFHPNYCFADSAPNDAANFTNRSPYPILHLLRESSIEKTLENYPNNPADIPIRNVDVARAKGSISLQKLLESCFAF